MNALCVFASSSAASSFSGEDVFASVLVLIVICFFGAATLWLRRREKEGKRDPWEDE